MTWVDPGPMARASWATEPHVVDEALATELVSHFVREGAHIRRVDVGSASSASEVVDALRAVLGLPDWCASGWDSLEDAFEELSASWPFPLLLLVEGHDRLMASAPQVALATVLALDRLRTGFALRHQQLEPAYVWQAVREDFFTAYRLSVQRALWGMVPESLHAVALGVTDGVGRARFVFDREPEGAQLELVQEVLSEVVADFSDDVTFDFTAVQCAGDRLTLKPGESWWAFVRALPS